VAYGRPYPFVARLHLNGAVNATVSPSLTLTLTFPVSLPEQEPYAVVAAAISAVVTATIPTAAQQAKETAQGGQSKESNGVACASMADASPRGSPMVDGDKRYFFSPC